MKQYIVDAFTDEPFKGNPAAVCVLDAWPSDRWMQKLAAENRFSETAYLVKEDEGWHLRWFTPSVEVELCGHATLASAFVVLNFYDTESPRVVFHTMSGDLTVARTPNGYEMDFPRYELTPIPVTDDMERTFGARPVEAVLGLDLVCVFENESIVREMAPDEELLVQLPGRIQNATARGALGSFGNLNGERRGDMQRGTLASSGFDCISRSFCPKLGIYEDPVCGSAHCQIADYWAAKLDKREIVAYQASSRGGVLTCRIEEDERIAIAGEATLISIADLQITPE